MHKKLKLKMFVCITALCLLGGYSSVYGEVSQGDLGVGLNYPGGSVRYLLTDNVSLELKGQMITDVGLVGLRGYWYFTPEKKLLPFVGLEADVVSFKGEESEGMGTAFGIFGGVEYFVYEPFSLQLDFGPAIVSLKDTDSTESVSGVDYVINVGINYYFRAGN